MSDTPPGKNEEEFEEFDDFGEEFEDFDDFSEGSFDEFNLEQEPIEAEYSEDFPDVNEAGVVDDAADFDVEEPALDSFDDFQEGGITDNIEGGEKKSSKMFNYAIYAAGVLTVGAIVYFQFFSGDSKSQAVKEIAKAQQAVPNQAPAVNKDQMANSAQNQGQKLSDILNSGQLGNDGGLLSNLDKLEKIQNTKRDDSMNAGSAEPELPVFAEPDVLGDLPMPTPIDNAASASLVETVEPIKAEPLNDPFERFRKEERAAAVPQAVKKELAVIEQESLKAIAKEKVEVEEQASTPATNKNDELEAFAEQLVENIEQFEKQTGRILARMDALDQKMDAVPDFDNIDSLSEKLSSIEARLAKLEKGTRNVRASQPASKKSTSASSAKVKAKPAVNWSLRAASPGRAWISKKGSDEFMQIGVGETVSGLGKIQSISQVNGRWLVQGSLNSLRQ